jgi:hypothetical protein
VLQEIDACDMPWNSGKNERKKKHGVHLIVACKFQVEMNLSDCSLLESGELVEKKSTK